jgi:CHAT domain-containing protein/tetratricopeptide (TPR) repeat protein
MMVDRLGQAGVAVALAYTEPGRACRLADEVLAADPGREAASVAEHALGMANTALSKLGAAETHLLRAVSLADGLVTRAAEARASLAYTLTLTGRTEEALAEVDRAVPVLRGHAAARSHMLRGLVLTELSRFDEASTGFEDALRFLQVAGGDALLEADIRTNRSILRVYRRDWRAAEDDLRRAEGLYVATGHPGRTAMVYHNRGMAAAVRGDVPAALSAYDEAAERYRAAGRGLGTLPIEKAEALLSVRLVAEARQAAELAVAEFAKQRNAIDLVQARLLLAQAALLDGDPVVARAEAERARRASVRQRRAGWAALAGYVALRARWDAGERTPVTMRAGRRVHTALTEVGWVVQALDARLIVARIALELGQVAVARQELADAVGAREHGPAELRARAWHATALLRLSDGDRSGAESALRAGMRVLDQFRASLGATELRAHASGHAGELARLGLGLAMESGRARSVLLWAERWRAGALRLRPVRPPDDAELAENLAELRQVVLQVGAADGDIAGLLARQAALEEKVRGRARRAPGSQTSGAVPSLDALAEALGPAALIEYLTLDGQLSAVVMVDGRVTLHPVGPLETVESELAALRFGLRGLAFQSRSARSLAAASALVDRKAAHLDDILLAPLRPEIGERDLVIVPTGALHALPWPALPGCVGRPVSVTPSAALWHRAATMPNGSDGRRVLASGPGLPHAAAEVAALTRRYRNARQFTGRRAMVEPVASALDGAELAHIAAHGHFRADNPLFSAIQLADGPLTVYDLERLGRPPRHIVLSTCDSALPAVHAGDELLGLTAALLAMGTRSLVATVVPVPDRATRPLMLRFHHHLDRGLAPAAALASAQRELGNRDTAAKVAAMGFLCFGAG